MIREHDPRVRLTLKHWEGSDHFGSRAAWLEYWADFTDYRDWSIFFSFRRASSE
jgi:hypothetical protein